jgi:hypothetical protein
MCTCKETLPLQAYDEAAAAVESSKHKSAAEFFGLLNPMSPRWLIYGWVSGPALVTTVTRHEPHRAPTDLHKNCTHCEDKGAESSNYQAAVLRLLLLLCMRTSQHVPCWVRDVFNCPHSLKVAARLSLTSLQGTKKTQ